MHTINRNSVSTKCRVTININVIWSSYSFNAFRSHSPCKLNNLLRLAVQFWLPAIFRQFPFNSGEWKLLRKTERRVQKSKCI
jgi:hypothetical protein